METVSEVIVVLVTDFIFRGFSRHFGFPADLENWGENAGGSTVFLIQDGGLNNIPMGISACFHYPKRTGQRLVGIPEENGTTFSD